jgi:uncharacterized protein (DUF2235 family)
MKRLILCFDGTWNTLGKTEEFTNVVRVGQAVKPIATGNVPQIVYYNSGVGSGGKVDQILGGAFGAGLQSNVQRGLSFLAFNYDDGTPAFEGDPPRQPDEVYVFGFSRGAYTARALAGVIGAIGGIPRVSHFGEVEQMWAHYRKGAAATEKEKEEIRKKVYDPPANGKIIKCVAVWDTVGAYGIPTGFGVLGLARQATAWTKNFRDNEIGRHIEYGFHAMAIDERRRSFTTTAWVESDPDDPKAKNDPREPAKVEQVWFAGVHANVGGGYKQAGLSDHALVWMMARVQDTAKLEFDEDYIQEHFLPCAACSAFHSSKGWWLSQLWPAIRAIPKRMRGERGVLVPGKGEIIDGRAHWSVKDRLGKRCLIDETRYYTYRPKQLVNMTDADYTSREDGSEDRMVRRCLVSADNEKKKICALHCDLDEMRSKGFMGRRRAKRIARLREQWADTIAAAKAEAP